MTFEWPYALAGLGLLPVVAALYVLAQRRRRMYAVRFTNLALLHEVVGRGPGIRRHIPPLFSLLGLTMLLVSLARPTAVIAVPREDTTVMLVMDVSGSMAADDLQPDRLTAAKQAAKAFLDRLPRNVQVGLVSFSTAASLNVPPTRDHAAVVRAIDRLRPGGGTAIGEGLYLALEQLPQPPAGAPPAPPGVVVLLSDGASNAGRSPEGAAARAQAEGVKVFTVGIGERGAVPRLGGRTPVQLDEAALQAIADVTGGTYFYAAESGDLQRIYAALGSQIAWVEERTEVTALFSALGSVLFLASGLLGLRWFQRLP